MKNITFLLVFEFIFLGISQSQVVGDARQIHGFVEVWNGTEWRPVCDDVIEDFATNAQNTGNVLCRQLNGVATATVTAVNRVTGATYFGAMALGTCVTPATDDFALDEVDCAGTETSIFLCPHNGINAEDCTATEAICVECMVNGVVMNNFPFPANPVDPNVPTLSQWGLIVLAIFMLIFGVVGIRQ